MGGLSEVEVAGGGEEVVAWVGGGGGGAEAGLYFTGDSLERKSRREGSRSRRGSVSVVFWEEDLFQNQPMLGFDCWLSGGLLG